MEQLSIDYLTKLKEEFNYSLSTYIRAVTQIGGKELSASLRNLRKVIEETNNYTDIYRDKLQDVITLSEIIKRKKVNKENYSIELEILSDAKYILN